MYVSMYIKSIFVYITLFVWTKKVSETSNEIQTINVCCKTENTALTINYIHTTYNT